MVIWLAILLWLASATLLGLTLALRGGLRCRGLFALLAYSVVAGHCLQAVALVFVWNLVPLSTGYYVVVASAAIAGIVASAKRTKAWVPLPKWELSPVDTALVTSALVATALITHVAFSVAYLGGDREALFWRAGVTSWLSRGLYPPTNPLEVAEILRYRYGLNMMSAAFSGASGELATISVAATVSLVFALMSLAFLGASCTLFGRPRPGLVAVCLGLLASSAIWILRLVQILSAGAASPDYTQEMLTSLLWGGSTLRLIVTNVSAASGLTAFAAAIWLCAEALNTEGKASFWLDLAAVAGISYLGLIYEVYFVSLLASLIVLGVLQWWRLRQENRGRSRLGYLARPLALVLVSLAIVAGRGGLLGGMPVTGEAEHSLGMALNLDHFGSVPVPYPKRISGWFPLLSTDTLLDTDLVLVGLPILGVIALRAMKWYSLLGLATCAVSLVAWLTAHPRMYPDEGYHFAQSAVVGYLALAPFAVASISRPTQRILRYLAGLGAVILPALVLLPGLTIAAWLVFFPPAPTAANPASADYAASKYLRQSADSWRVLVPCRDGFDTTEQLAEEGAVGLAMRTVVGLSGHSVPLGFSADFKSPSETRALYARASASFDAQTLDALRIDWVYVLPSYLSDRQRDALTRAAAEGRLQLKEHFGKEGGENERLLYRVSPK